MEPARPSAIVIEDNPYFQMFLEEIVWAADSLKLGGIAADGKLGVELARRLRPNVIFVDLQMPRMDGFEALPHLRKSVPQCVIIVATMHSVPDVEKRCLELGADAVLSKNLDQDEMGRQVERVLAAHPRYERAHKSAPPPSRQSHRNPVEKH